MAPAASLPPLLLPPLLLPQYVYALPERCTPPWWATQDRADEVLMLEGGLLRYRWHYGRGAAVVLLTMVVGVSVC